MIDDNYNCLNKQIAGRSVCDYRIEYYKSYYQNNRIKLKEYNKSYYENNKDKWKQKYNRKNRRAFNHCIC